jgi:hypothetical protein
MPSYKQAYLNIDVPFPYRVGSLLSTLVNRKLRWETELLLELLKARSYVLAFILSLSCIVHVKMS